MSVARCRFNRNSKPFCLVFRQIFNAFAYSKVNIKYIPTGYLVTAAQTIDIDTMPQGDVATMGHRHVMCDGCQRHEFPGRRYRCLRCSNYDLCGECYDQCVQTEHHLMEHPMQLILLQPQPVPELLSAGGAVEQLHLCNCYTCPYCKVMGHTAKGLINHVYGLHSEDDSYVVCPMCACLPGASLMTMQNLSRHLLTSHIDYANFLEPHTPQLQRLPQEAIPDSRHRRSRGHLHHHYQQQNAAAYAQMVNTGQFATDTLPDLSNVQISHDLMNNLRSLYTDDEIDSMMMGHDNTLTLNATGRASSTPNTPPITLVDRQPEKRREKKERRTKTDRFLLSKWMAAEQKQWKMSAEARKVRHRQAIFTEQILLSMMCAEQLELPESDPIADTLDLKPFERESIETVAPNRSKAGQPLETGKNTQPMENLQTLESDTALQPLENGTALQTLKTGTVSEPKISKIMSLMALPWTQAWSASQTDNGNGTAIKQFIQLMGATTDETQVDEMKNVEAVD
ncbi:E3 ubiquitin-protein ligase KCMF1 [Drosophila obscura]|uniref:E3 ubiquitin-protein ligase KCMF1 n=1 Tax=Drosophila obscura TaxID=7282 RepID=UPI000BA0104A|nr:E3 ubiquitin-protein ligase KCMF1 [Drosophila obscura]